MHKALWPESFSDHDAETRRYFEEPDASLITLVAVIDGPVVGFPELDHRRPS